MSMSTELTTDAGYQSLLGRISVAYTTGQLRAHQAVNAQLTDTFWQIGRDIVEFEQDGKARADYGKKALLANLSRDLTQRHGKGFSRSNVVRMRQFYLAYPIGATVSRQLGLSVVADLPVNNTFKTNSPTLRPKILTVFPRPLDQRSRPRWKEIGSLMNIKRYVTLLPQRSNKMATLTIRVNEHVMKMGATWK